MLTIGSTQLAKHDHRGAVGSWKDEQLLWWHAFYDTHGRPGFKRMGEIAV